MAKEPTSSLCWSFPPKSSSFAVDPSARFSSTLSKVFSRVILAQPVSRRAASRLSYPLGGQGLRRARPSSSTLSPFFAGRARLSFLSRSLLSPWRSRPRLTISPFLLSNKTVGAIFSFLLLRDCIAFPPVLPDDARVFISLKFQALPPSPVLGSSADRAFLSAVLKSLTSPHHARPLYAFFVLFSTAPGCSCFGSPPSFPSF